MSATVEMTATRHMCSSSLNAHYCTRGDGKARRKYCYYCRAAVREEQGTWAVFVWAGDARYRLRDAVTTFKREAAAQKYCDAHPRDNVVVRWVSA